MTPTTTRLFIILFSLGVCLAPKVALAQDWSEVNYPMRAFGSDLDYGFLGGIVNPIFNNADLNQDGNTDIIIFDRLGNRSYTFLHTGEEGVPSFVHAPQYEKSIPRLTSWALFRDYNADGIVDIFTNAPQSSGSIGVYRGNMDSGVLQFERVLFPDDPLDIIYYDYISPISGNVQRFNLAIPFETDVIDIADIDFDGDLDIVTFDSGGALVNYYRNTAVDDGLGLDELYFIEETCWGRFKEDGLSAEIFLSDNPSLCASSIAGHETSGTRHSGSTICIIDKDGDGDSDIILGDIGSTTMTALTNGGTPTEGYMTEVETMYPQNDIAIDQYIHPAAFHIDADNDGRRDLVVAPSQKESGINIDHIWFYKNVGTDAVPDFMLLDRDFMMDNTINIGRYTHPTFIDYNADGLQDILVGSAGYTIDNDERSIGLHLFENVGTLDQPAFDLVDDDYLGFSELIEFSSRLAPTVGDLDGDGDVDLLIGDDTGKFYYFDNSGGSGAPVSYSGYTYKYMDIDVGSFAKPQIFDFNNDGLADIIAGESNTANQNPTTGAIGQLNYFENIGTIGDPQFESEEENPPNNNALGAFQLSANLAPVFYDRADGERILFVGTDLGGIYLFDEINSVDAAFNLKEENLGDILIGRNTVPAFTDIDNDGYLEMLLGNRRGGLDFYNTTYTVGGFDTAVSELTYDDWRIYPNPASQSMEIQSEAEISSISIYSYTGKKALRSGDGTRQVDVSTLPPGIYIMQILTNDQLIGNKKFVVMR